MQGRHAGIRSTNLRLEPRLGSKYSSTAAAYQPTNSVNGARRRVSASVAVRQYDWLDYQLAPKMDVFLRIDVLFPRGHFPCRCGQRLPVLLHQARNARTCARIDTHVRTRVHTTSMHRAPSAVRTCRVDFQPVAIFLGWF